MNKKTVFDQEESLQFTHFSNDDAQEIGGILIKNAKRRGISISVDISRGMHTLFRVCMPGTTMDNVVWMKRKRNSVYHFEKSSVCLEIDVESGLNEIERGDLPPEKYASSGGGVPVRIKGTGFVGAVVISGSGLTGPQDHELVIEAIAEFSGIADYPSLNTL
jgi:uncharacterized protein (UPF0303 family)